MVCLRQAVEKLFEGILTPLSFNSFPMCALRSFWYKDIKDLTPEEWAYTLAAMVEIGASMLPEESEAWKMTLLKPNPILKLIKKVG